MAFRSIRLEYRLLNFRLYSFHCSVLDCTPFFSYRGSDWSRDSDTFCAVQPHHPSDLFGVNLEYIIPSLNMEITIIMQNGVVKLHNCTTWKPVRLKS